MSEEGTPQRIVLYTEDDPLVLANGEVLPEVEVAYRTYGELDADSSNAVFICHALTGDAEAADWWAAMVGPGKPVDTNRFFVICPNLLGGCRGTTGPRSVNPVTGKRYDLDFPQLDMSDFVAVHRRLVERLGIDRLHAAVGGSLGGMQILQWLIESPDAIERAVLIGASSRLTAMNIAFSTVARRAIMGDPDFEAGAYADGAGPKHGLSVARMLGHITYLSEQALTEKFDRRLQHGGEPRRDFGIDFAVESYLDYQGESFVKRFDALTYLYLSRVMDYFDPFADPDAAARIASGAARFLVLSFDSDWRFDTAQSRRIVDALDAGGVPVSFREISSPWGHDSFLMELPGYQSEVAAFLC
ncbi:homoserine O-acetyltransferase [Nocardioidaceae bacterium SCSIO 66511]|nr:homoserine O-acetyltransferase [Nocardioidaceae bacterium SCSIO 66511]